MRHGKSFETLKNTHMKNISMNGDKNRKLKQNTSENKNS